MKAIDLNVDIGEGFPYDRELLRVATSANVCCGSHAGSAELTRQTIDLCLEAGVQVGAHPGYPDRQSMGREPWTNFGAAWDSLCRQLDDFINYSTPSYIKPHGALYNQSASDGPAADFLVRLLERFRLPLLGLAGSFHKSVASSAGVKFAAEGFADRRYTSEGLLAPRSEPGSVLAHADEVLRQAVGLADRVDSICIHGDSPGCVHMAEQIAENLKQAGWRLAPWL